MMCIDREVCRAVYDGGSQGGTRCLGWLGRTTRRWLGMLGLPFVAEIYGDVKYSKDGKLVIVRKKM